MARKRKRNEPKKDFWSTLCKETSDGQVIPIISNAVKNDPIFDINWDGKLGLLPDSKTDDIKIPYRAMLNVNQQLAARWAAELGYPLSDKNRLERVAVYNQIKSKGPKKAKEDYLSFLKIALLEVAEKDKEVREIVKSLKPVELRDKSISEMRKDDDDDLDTLYDYVQGSTFSDIANELNYPKSNKQHQDPLDFLAGLDLPLYITTSCHDFMERALDKRGKKPRTKVCDWFGKSSLDELHRPEAGVDGDPKNPIVYHLFGFEQYPNSLVISEDDYLDFLVQVSKERDNPKSEILTPQLTASITQKSLLLLGYRLQDLEFKAFFRGMIETTEDLNEFGVAIQLDPKMQKEIEDEEDAKKYLHEYLNYPKSATSLSFDVEWGTTESFLHKFKEELAQWQKRQP